MWEDEERLGNDGGCEGEGEELEETRRGEGTKRTMWERRKGRKQRNMKKAR